jgi:hypothetical protein
MTCNFMNSRGDIVKRSNGWSRGDQDGGEGGTGMVDEVTPDKFVWVRWAEGNRNLYEEKDLKVVGYVQNINIGDIVERGPDWKYGDQDGGPDKKAVVMQFADSGLEVYCKWRNGTQANYRWGYAYDLKVVKSIR